MTKRMKKIYTPCAWVLLGVGHPLNVDAPNYTHLLHGCSMTWILLFSGVYGSIEVSKSASSLFGSHVNECIDGKTKWSLIKDGDS